MAEGSSTKYKKSDEKRKLRTRISIALILSSELLVILSLFMPWLSIKMSVPIAGFLMNGTYNFFLLRGMSISIEGFPGAFSGSLPSGGTRLLEANPIFMFPLISAFLGLLLLIKALKGANLRNQAAVSSFFVIATAVGIKLCYRNLLRGDLKEFIGLMKMLGAKLSFSSPASNIYLMSGVLMLVPSLHHLIEIIFKHESRSEG